MMNPFLEGFHKLSHAMRLKKIREFADLSEREIEEFAGLTPPPVEMAEHFIENVVGYFSMPLGVANHFCIDGKSLLIPMAVEETSIIAAASATAKWVQREGTLVTSMKGDWIIGQIQLPQVKNLEYAKNTLQERSDEMIAIANSQLRSLVARGGGVKSISIRELDRPDGKGKMIVVHVYCDPCDAMGANLINQVCEYLKVPIQLWTDERVGLCILSNLVDTKLAQAHIEMKDIDPVLGRGIEEASLFAETDPYRAATHNKGVLNGIDPILIATGNDWRAVEAGVHAYAARSGSYQPITKWRFENGSLVGTFEAPMAVGVVGGMTRVHPAAKVALKIMDVHHSEDLARICAAVGLVQNLGALRALSTVGIVKGHMQLHAANLALAAGAELHEVPEVRAQLVRILERDNKIQVSQAQAILHEIRSARNIN